MTQKPRMSTEETPTDAADPEGVADQPAPGNDGDDAPPVSPGVDLGPDEGADVGETAEEAAETPQRDDVREDEDIITLDGSD